MRKKSSTPIVTLLVLLLLAASLLGGMVWFMMTHFFVGGKPYAKDAQMLDLRGETITVQKYEAIREKLPDAEIRWSVPFQGKTYDDTTRKLTVSSLSDQDLKVLKYFPQLSEVDASGYHGYDMLRKLEEQYPHIALSYTVMIGGREYDRYAEEVVCVGLTDEEIGLLALMENLKHVDATGCKEYDRLHVLAEAFPDVKISYQVELHGQVFTEADTAATFEKPDVDLLLENLGQASALETVHLVEPAADAAKLRKLMETYPDVAITWDKTVLGKTFHSGDTEYDLTETEIREYVPYSWATPLDAEGTANMTRMVEEAMAYFPNAEKVILPEGCVDNETMGAFREKMRPEYKVVWTVYVTKKPVRTDQEVIHSSAYKVCFIDELSQDLKYCEDAIVVDIGHSYVKNIEWVKGMPNLKYLILTHNWVKDLTPISTCKNLVYLEIYWNDYIPDYTPLLGCTSLKDLNLSGTFADPEPLTQMTWLENLWATCTGFSAAEEQMLKDSLPNTNLKFGAIDYSAGGWRDVPRYFEMRDIMGLGYNSW